MAYHRNSSGVVYSHVKAFWELTSGMAFWFIKFKVSAKLNILKKRMSTF